MIHSDNIVVFEVMADEIDAGWWVDFRQQLEASFRREEIVIRAHKIDRL
jgi:hypothetical protein